ncbi:STM4011 family radical SAM protein [Clostridium sp. Marseille-P2415]|uniref:STM4011 family radical SAM protein n=1 Tax=Clostridium sp. Marseille-P2415 TaxID=1805471 RepID=UPI00190ED1CA|nr:STM4011 family radical SAM protein [Clostridium sp. Marseille-P2415]
MAIKTILYRGSLKSCNYNCSYCPFSKHKSSRGELAKDQEQLQRFINSLREQAPRLGTEALMIVPYGEILIHPYYWEGLARISSMETIEAVGAQTNLSFSMAKCLKKYAAAGGHREKLRLWATFHPEMTSLSQFIRQCKKLIKEGISFSVGAVGIPENLDLLRQLRECLPEEIYLWINRMDGVKRPYTADEQAAFQSIDPFFAQELGRRQADKSQCLNRLFVEGDGKLRLCNIGHSLKENWYNCNGSLPSPECGRAACTCYLAYGGRADYDHSGRFGPYPLFRIPWKPKAFFFDIDGTLVFDRSDRVDPAVISWLKAVKEHGPLFLATSLPYKEAARRCRDILHLFDGGIFAGGAHILLKRKGKRIQKEVFYTLDASFLPVLDQKQAEYGYRLRVYQSDGSVYKITLEKPSSRAWREPETASLKHLLPISTFRCFTEKNCFQIVSSTADKGSSMRKLCEWLSISTRDCAAALTGFPESLPWNR